MSNLPYSKMVYVQNGLSYRALAAQAAQCAPLGLLQCIGRLSRLPFVGR